MYESLSQRQRRVLRQPPADDAPTHEAGGMTGALQRLQRTAGNAAVTELIQTKLQVGAANDPLEHEADRVADSILQAMRDPEQGQEGVEEVTSAGPVMARAQDEAVQAVVGLEGGAAPDSAVEAIGKAGAGSPLPDELQRTAGAVLGADLSGVRVHTGPSSQQAAAELGAVAFTKGSDIHFGGGQYDPSSAAGQKLLAHEVAHTVQQGGGAQRQTIRRMPSPAAVTSLTGKEEKKGRKIFGKRVGATNTYSALLDALRDHSNFIVNNAISLRPGVLDYQVDEIHRLIDRVVAAATTYLAKKDAEPAVADVCRAIIQQAPMEKRVVAAIAAKWRTNPYNVPQESWNDPSMTPKWFSQIPNDPRKVKAVGGGSAGKQKEVTKVTNATGASGYFSEDGKDGDYSEQVDIIDQETQQPSGFKKGKYEDAAEMLKAYGQDDENLRLGARSIAMSRLDSLLGGGVVARTEEGLLGDKVGTFQWEAKGKAMSEAYDKGEEIEDPELARLLSRLQLIDTIAGQIDRHPGNYFVQRDPKTGKVLGVTGIDLDMSWVGKGGDAKRGLRFDVESGSRSNYDDGRADQFPGFSRFVDKEMAEVIIKLDPDDLRAILADLLTPDMIEAAIERLEALQKLLLSLQKDGLLIEPHEWKNHLKAIKAEHHVTKKDENKSLTAKSYYGRDAS